MKGEICTTNKKRLSDKFKQPFIIEQIYNKFVTLISLLLSCVLRILSAVCPVHR